MWRGNVDDVIVSAADIDCAESVNLPVIHQMPVIEAHNMLDAVCRCDGHVCAVTVNPQRRIAAELALNILPRQRSGLRRRSQA